MVSLWEALAGSTVLEMKKIESLIIFSPVILHSEKCLNVVTSFQSNSRSRTLLFIQPPYTAPPSSARTRSVIVIEVISRVL
jgi:hypothetical protein